MLRSVGFVWVAVKPLPFLTYEHEKGIVHLVRAKIVIPIEAKYRKMWYQNVHKCIGYTIRYF
mgnify:CR=1 FL=1